MQRLFSTFPNGLPGAGLLLQRLITGGVLIEHAIAQFNRPFAHPGILPDLIAATASGLLIIGLWTPVAGSVVAMIEFLSLFFRDGDPILTILLMTLGATLALIGPGAWSLDARIFGRKQISVPDRNRTRFSD